MISSGLVRRLWRAGTQQEQLATRHRYSAVLANQMSPKKGLKKGLDKSGKEIYCEIFALAK